MLDFNFFFAQCALALALSRLNLIHAVATDERLARQLYNCYSAPARLRVIAALVLAASVDQE